VQELVRRHQRLVAVAGDGPPGADEIARRRGCVESTNIFRQADGPECATLLVLGMAFLQQHGIDGDAGDHPLMRGAVRGRGRAVAVKGAIAIPAPLRHAMAWPELDVMALAQSPYGDLPGGDPGATEIEALVGAGEGPEIAPPADALAPPGW
jgi:hypothetical protein